MVTGAAISECGRFRYRLWRRWDRGQALIWIMLNPSTADGETDDPTIRKCMGFARQFGFSGIEVVNLYAVRATDPKELLARPDLIEESDADNKRLLSDILMTEADVVCAWGSHKSARPMAKWVRECAVTWGSELECLGVTKDGSPRHPLYLPYSAALQPWWREKR